MNQENQLTEQNSEETEIDLLEIFYLLRAKLVWLILAFVKFWNRGSVAQFLTAFYKDHKLTKEEIEELRKSIDELDQ